MPIKTSLSNSDIEALTSQANNLRDRLIVSFLWDTGVRVSELLKVTIGNIDLEKREVLIPHLKRGIHKVCPVCNKQGGRRIAFCSRCGSNLSRVEAVGIEERSRIIDIGDDLVIQIKEFLSGEEHNPNEPLIKLTRQGVYEVIRKLSEAAGLGGKIMLNPETSRRHFVHPHDFRASLATDGLEMAKNDVSMQKALQSKLGHKSLDTTSRYNRLTASSIKNFSAELREKRKKK